MFNDNKYLWLQIWEWTVGKEGRRGMKDDSHLEQDGSSGGGGETVQDSRSFESETWQSVSFNVTSSRKPDVRPGKDLLVHTPREPGIFSYNHWS